MSKTIIGRTIAAALLLVSIAAPALAQEVSDEQNLVNKAQQTLQTFAADPDMAWFRNHLRDAKGLFIVPNVVRGGFIFGGSGGSGVLLTRDGRTGEWSYPAFYTMGSVSFGLQAGVDVSEVALMVMTEKGLDSFLSGSFKLGADVSVAAGPVGAGAAAQTADVIAFSRAKGVYGGLSVSGAVIEPRESWDSAYYGRPVRSVDILVQRSVRNPQADPLRAAVASAARRSGT